MIRVAGPLLLSAAVGAPSSKSPAPDIAWIDRRGVPVPEPEPEAVRELSRLKFMSDRVMSDRSSFILDWNGEGAIL